VTVNDVRGVRTVEVRYIPTSNKDQAELLTRVKWVSASGFYGLYALGMLDALLHHQDEVVRTYTEKAQEPAPRARLHLVPLSGGASAGLTLDF
jgi:hypothetical protein